MIVSLEGLPVFVEVFWKSGVALGTGLCISGLLRKKSADVRRLVLSTAVVAMFVAAMSLPALPRWRAIMPDWLRLENPSGPVVTASRSGFATQDRGTGPGQTISGSELRITTSNKSRTWLPNSMPGPIPLIWCVGSLLLLAKFAVSLRGLRRLRAASESVSDFELESHGVALLQSEAIPAPVTWGIFRPVILVPARFEQLPAESRNAVLCHELAHIHGHDFIVRVLAEIARAALWFQPLMWIVRRQLRVEQELACDNRVLAAGGRPSTYAKLLMDWAEPTPANDSLLAVGMAQRSSLNRRLFALLDRDLKRNAVSTAGVLAICTAGLAAALPLAAISFTHAIPAQPAGPRAMQLAPPAPNPPRVQIAQAQVQAPVPRPVAADTAPLPEFSTSVMLVILDATVKDSNGRNRDDLKVSDFTVTEDGVTQPISLFDFQKLDDAPQGLGSYYIVAYYTTNFKEDGSYRRVKLALKDDTKSTLDFRSGYFANKRFDRSVTTDDGVYMIDGVTCQGCNNSVGPGVTFPVLISQKQPQYSEQARKAKYSGIVTLNVGVDASGKVTDIRIAKSLGMGLDEQAADAVQKWEFRPGMKNGRPVAVRVQVDVNFRLL